MSTNAAELRERITLLPRRTDHGHTWVSLEALMLLLPSDKEELWATAPSATNSAAGGATESISTTTTPRAHTWRQPVQEWISKMQAEAQEWRRQQDEDLWAYPMTRAAVI